MKYTRVCSLRAMAAIAVLAGGFATSASAAIVTGVTVAGGDAAITNTGGRTAQRENDIAGVITLFGEDKPIYLDRTHQYNGPRFTAAGVLTATNPAAAGDVTKGLPAYLIGGEYVSTMQSHRDNLPGFRIDVAVGPAVNAYLLIDNRVGDSINTDPPVLTTMPWVLTDGWVLQNTGISPNGQPDFAAVDEGATITDFNTRPTNTAGLGVGPGVEIQNFYTIYKKSFAAGSTINLKEQNFGGINMYGLVVQQVPEPSSVALLGLGAMGLVGWKGRRARRAA